MSVRAALLAVFVSACGPPGHFGVRAWAGSDARGRRGVALDANEGAVEAGWFGAAAPVPPGASVETTPDQPPTASDGPGVVDAPPTPNDVGAAPEVPECSLPDGPEWRGRGRIDPDGVRTVVSGRQNDLKTCYLEFVSRRQLFNVSARVHFLVSRDGTVAQVDACLSIDDPEFMRCIGDVFRSLQLPRPAGGGARVIYPIQFRP